MSISYRETEEGYPILGNLSDGFFVLTQTHLNNIADDKDKNKKLEEQNEQLENLARTLKEENRKLQDEQIRNETRIEMLGIQNQNLLNRVIKSEGMLESLKQSIETVKQAYYAKAFADLLVYRKNNESLQNEIKKIPVSKLIQNSELAVANATALISEIDPKSDIEFFDAPECIAK